MSTGKSAAWRDHAFRNHRRTIEYAGMLVELPQIFGGPVILDLGIGDGKHIENAMMAAEYQA